MLILSDLQHRGLYPASTKKFKGLWTSLILKGVPLFTRISKLFYENCKDVKSNFWEINFRNFQNIQHHNQIQLNNILVQYGVMYVTDDHAMVQAIIYWRLTT
jgi:hypothetical protein